VGESLRAHSVVNYWQTVSEELFARWRSLVVLPDGKFVVSIAGEAYDARDRGSTWRLPLGLNGRTTCNISIPHGLFVKGVREISMAVSSNHLASAADRGGAPDFLLVLP